MVADSADTPTVGDVLNGVLDDLLPYERAKKASVESRGLAVITSSGALASLLLALAGIVTGLEGFSPPYPTRLLLTGAVVLFTAASVLGIYCNSPANYLDIDPSSLELLANEEYWDTAGPDASLEIALCRIKVLTGMRHRTERKARVLVGATICEVAAVSLVAGAGAWILL